jgi:protocatechuate 3,4-dioxygenase, beta subunit
MKRSVCSAALVTVLALTPLAAAAQTRNDAVVQNTQALPLTPRQMEGPYYPTQKLADRDNDLTRVGDGNAAQGQALVLSGRLVDDLNTPIHSARIELWQTDHRGIYMHPNDPGTAGRDQNFQFYGEAYTDDAGRFSFRTIVPGVYGTRPRHIHVKIIPQSGPALTTQIYFQGDERLSSDRIVRRLGAEISALLLNPVQSSPDAQTAEITFVVRRS